MTTQHSNSLLPDVATAKPNKLLSVSTVDHRASLLVSFQQLMVIMCFTAKYYIP